MKNPFNIGCFSLIAIEILLVILKTTRVIKWSWIWVTAPLWITFALCFVVFIICLYISSTVEKEIKKNEDEE